MAYRIDRERPAVCDCCGVAHENMPLTSRIEISRNYNLWLCDLCTVTGFSDAVSLKSSELATRATALGFNMVLAEIASLTAAPLYDNLIAILRHHGGDLDIRLKLIDSTIYLRTAAGTLPLSGGWIHSDTDLTNVFDLIRKNIDMAKAATKGEESDQ